MKKLMKLIFRKELANYDIKYKEFIREKEEENQIKIKMIERESKKKYEQYRLIKRIFDIDKGSKIVGMKNNKNNEELIITERVTDSCVWVKLYGRSYPGAGHLPRIMGSLRKTLGEPKLRTYIKIDDIINIDDNIGNGSIMMEHYIKLAKSLGVEYISGLLSEVDKDHFERSERFYKKFGFEVSFNENKTNGSIRLDL
ncbi:hypothetical protein PRVXH_002306 [Proteinivorax hydrogeniformans]|uniref:N-acetyltransferase domain-containing protein n=1 Tax=Proteinivorax hydrogeniformans TaxID=1826727 RepID=A0AAU8HS14_9FIRM